MSERKEAKEAVQAHTDTLRAAQVCVWASRAVHGMGDGARSCLL
jgi:hypothetical protein